jgi:hypothetical protein
MSFRPTFVAAVLLLASLPARGEAPPARAVQPTTAPPVVTLDRTNEEGVVSGGRTVDVMANVKAVDLAARTVTLKGPQGRVETLKVGPEVTNLEKIEKGDRVRVRYREGLVLRFQAPGTPDVAPEKEKKVAKTGVGDVLSGNETVRVRETVTVVAIDLAARTVTLQRTGGKPHVVKAGPDVALDRVKVGDRFTATYSSATAVTVEPVYRK